MPFDDGLAERLTEMIPADESGLVETRMFGGFGYLLNGNMCVGIHKESLIIRVGKETASRIIGEPGVREMDLTGKVMAAWATLEDEALEDDERMRKYIQLSIDFVKTLPGK